MTSTRQELTTEQLEKIWAGAVVDIWRSDGSWECTVIDPDGETAATFGDPISALH